LSTSVPPNSVSSPRHKYFIDSEVQAALLIRASIYGLSLTLYFVITLVCIQWTDGPGRSFVDLLVKCGEDAVFWLPGFFMLTAIASHDLLKMTNQFAGPITRLRREMKLLIENQSERPLTFREDDYWVDITSSYNQIRGELLLLRRRLRDTGEDVGLPSSLFADDELEDTVRLTVPSSPAVGQASPELTAV
jgi:hypothetical protein